MRVGEGEEGSKNPKVEGSVTKTIAWSRPLIFLLHHPGLPTPTPTPRQSLPGSHGPDRRLWKQKEAELVRSGELGFIEDSGFLITMATKSHPQHPQ